MIIEKLLPQELEDHLQKHIMSPGFWWQWNAENIIVTTPDDYVSQMTHVFFYGGAVRSRYFALVNSIVGYFLEKTKFKLKRIVRIKANLIHNLVHNEQSLINMNHTDLESHAEGNYISIVYYVDTSDGDTVIYEEDRKTVKLTVSPIKGNCVWFDGKNTWHRSNIPTHHKRRVVINFVLEVE